MKKFIKKTILIFSIIMLVYFIVTIVIYNINKKYMGKSNQISVSYNDGGVVIPENTPIIKANINYFRAYFYLGIPIKIATPLLFLMTGVVTLIEKRYKGSGMDRIVKRGVSFFIIFAVFNGVVDFPKQFFDTFIRGKLLGVSNKEFLIFIMDLCKENFLSIIVIAPTIWVIYYTYKTTKWWYFYVWGIISLTMIFGNYLYPYYEGITSNVKLIEDNSLLSDIERIARKGGVEEGEFREIIMSDKTRGINAYLTGIFNSKKIVIWDNSIQQLNRDEIEALVAHELAHYKNEDILKDIIISQLINLMVMIVGQWIFKRIYKRDNRTNVGMFKMLFILNLLLFMVSPLKLAYSRFQESRADSYAMELLEGSAASSNLEVRLLVTSNMPIEVDPLFKWLYYTHPTPRERIEKCNEWNETR